MDEHITSAAVHHHHHHHVQVGT